ncbi:YqgE/AlgH family protein [Brumimicrobium oceani]|uniref:Transcriptional regulator n=1 Tax=Brumimicrobium oceani TaxID=2100725 RepID=A0A2U2XF44_9FLAO|nr:YqgE/AlgH family protein [Brumimicrobium oceani]PWH86360.1 transcriptional regulator [Brumimicrobium oceani]
MAIDLSFENKRKPRKGRVLISDPFSKDDYFGRSVVYMCDHNSEGTFGFVLTNYLDIDLSEVAKNFPDVGANISVGGPVQTENIFFIHTLGDQLPGSVEVDDGIYIGGDYDLLTQQLNEGTANSTQVRFFLGYSGWDPGQLEEEINRNNWIVAPVLNSQEIMDTSVTDIWQRFMKREGKKYDILSRAPLDFNDN